MKKTWVRIFLINIVVIVYLNDLFSWLIFSCRWRRTSRLFDEALVLIFGSTLPNRKFYTKQTGQLAFDLIWKHLKISLYGLWGKVAGMVMIMKRLCSGQMMALFSILLSWSQPSVNNWYFLLKILNAHGVWILRNSFCIM